MNVDVIPDKLNVLDALRMVKCLADSSKNIIITNHAYKRKKERKITRKQIELCLQRGTISEGPFRNQNGHWQVNMFRHAAGEEVTCTVAIDWGKKLIVITAF